MVRRACRFIKSTRDDSAILSTSYSIQAIQNRLQKHIKEIEIWLRHWKIQVNADKNAAVSFSRKIDKSPCIQMMGVSIPWENTTKYLGVYLDKRLTWKPHIDYVKSKLQKAMFTIFPLIGKYSPLSIKNKVLLYKSLLRPVITYASPVWDSASVTQINELERKQNIILRRSIAKAHWYVRNSDIRTSLQVETLSDFIKKLAVKFYNSLENHPNSEITNISTYDYNLLSNIHRPRAILR